MFGCPSAKTGAMECVSRKKRTEADTDDQAWGSEKRPRQIGETAEFLHNFGPQSYRISARFSQSHRISADPLEFPQSCRNSREPTEKPETSILPADFTNPYIRDHSIPAKFLQTFRIHSRKPTEFVRTWGSSHHAPKNASCVFHPACVLKKSSCVILCSSVPL